MGLSLQGLQESIHPYDFVAREGFKEILKTPTAKDKIVPVLPKIISPLKTALVIHNVDNFLLLKFFFVVRLLQS